MREAAGPSNNAATAISITRRRRRKTVEHEPSYEKRNESQNETEDEPPYGSHEEPLPESRDDLVSEAHENATEPVQGSAGSVPAEPEPVDLSAAVQAAQRGDEAAFRVVYRAVQPGLLRYLRVLVGEDAEDVASEAWLQIARDLSSFRGDADGFRGWAATVGRHRALDHLRRLRRRPEPGMTVDDLEDRPGDDDTAGSALDSLATDGALRLISRLPRDQAEAVLLRVVMGLDAKAAAEVLGKRPGAVRTAAYRGLRKLGEYLGAQGSGPGSGPGSGLDSTGDGEADLPVPKKSRSGRARGVTKKRASTLKDMR